MSIFIVSGKCLLLNFSSHLWVAIMFLWSRSCQGQILKIAVKLSVYSTGPANWASWGCIIHWLQKGKNPSPTNKCFEYDIKQSDGEVPVMLELWGMWSTPSLALLPGPLWSGVVAPDRVLSVGQIKLFDI